MPTGASGASRRGEGGFWTVFGTATLPTATSGASRRGEEPPDQRQTGLCSMQRPVILLSGLPPDLPDGFIRRPYRPSDRSSLPPTLPTGFVSQTFRPPDRQTFRPSDRPALPTALPEALAGRVTWVILTGWFYTPDLPAGFVPAALPAATPASHTGQPHQPATPASHTSQPNQPAQPTNPTGHPHRPSSPPPTPTKVPPASLTGRLRSAGRRLRGWRSSRHG